MATGDIRCIPRQPVGGVSSPCRDAITMDAASTPEDAKPQPESQALAELLVYVFAGAVVEASTI